MKVLIILVMFVFSGILNASEREIMFYTSQSSLKCIDLPNGKKVFHVTRPLETIHFRNNQEGDDEGEGKEHPLKEVSLENSNLCSEDLIEEIDFMALRTFRYSQGKVFESDREIIEHQNGPYGLFKITTVRDFVIELYTYKGPLVFKGTKILNVRIVADL